MDETAGCCSETNCRRKQPVLVRRGPFSDRWMVITRYKHRSDKGMIEAQEKHEIDADSQVEMELGSSVLVGLHAHVKGQYEAADRGSPAEAAYRDVLDKLAELAEAKETELVGPRRERKAS